MRLPFAATAVLGSLLLAAPAYAQTAGCQFTLGFQALHEAIPAQVGDCTGDVSYAANGDALQHTTNGLLVWDKADNFSEFTNGTMTWIEGPTGLALRANGARFPWETPESNVASASVQAINPASLMLTPTDADVPPNFVLSDQSAEGGGFSLTLRSFYQPEQSLSTTVATEPSHADALATLANVSAQYPASNAVQGRLGKSPRNEGTAGIGDQSITLASSDRQSVVWVKDRYLLEVDDATGQGIGLAIVRARDVENKLESLLVS